MDEIANIYIGDATRVKCMRTFYELLMAGHKVTAHMILAKIAGEDLHAFDSKDLDNDLPQELKKYRAEQKQIMKPMLDLLKKHVGDDIKRKHIGNHRYEFVYSGTDKDPLRGMRSWAVVKNIEDFRQFCYDSAGFFPASWIEHFFRDTKEFLNIAKKRKEGDHLMIVSIDRDLDNISFLPQIYEAIRDQKIIEFDYRSQFNDEAEHRMVHPHLLHEFNGRWHLFGYEEKEKWDLANIALDRIKGDITLSKTRKKYRPAVAGFYAEYFKNMLGVTHGIPPTPEDWHESKPHCVCVRAYSKYIYGLTASKPIHHSQRPIEGYDETKGYGDFELYVELNNEFIGRILQMGPGLEIISPPHYREVFVQRVAEMAQKYGITEKAEEK